MPPRRSLTAALAASAFCLATSLAHATDPDVLLRAVDWCNRGYGSYLPTLSRCRGTTTESHYEGGGIHSIDTYEFLSVTYGELTGDAQEDAFVIIDGTSRPVIITPGAEVRIGVMFVVERRGTELFVYPGALTGDAPILRASIENGVVTLLRHPVGRARCAERWRLVDQQLTEQLPRGCEPPPAAAAVVDAGPPPADAHAPARPAGRR